VSLRRIAAGRVKLTEGDAAGAEVEGQAVIAEEIEAEEAVDDGRGRQGVTEDEEVCPLLARASIRSTAKCGAYSTPLPVVICTREGAVAGS